MLINLTGCKDKRFYRGKMPYNLRKTCISLKKCPIFAA